MISGTETGDLWTLLSLSEENLRERVFEKSSRTATGSLFPAWGSRTPPLVQKAWRESQVSVFAVWEEGLVGGESPCKASVFA